MTEHVWRDGDPCPYCGNDHTNFVIEGGSDGAVAICPPSERDRIAAQIANQLWLGLQEAVKLEPESVKIRTRLEEVDELMKRGREIVTPL